MVPNAITRSSQTWLSAAAAAAAWSSDLRSILLVRMELVWAAKAVAAAATATTGKTNLKRAREKDDRLDTPSSSVIQRWRRPPQRRHSEWRRQGN